MVDAVRRRGGGPDIALTMSVPSAMSIEFPSTTAPPNWYTLPSYNSAIMNPDTGTIGIPWNNFLTFASARAATITGLTSNVSTLQGQVVVIQGQIATLQGEVASNTSNISTLQGQVSTLQGQVAILQSQVATIQVQITALQAEDVYLQGQITVLDQITDTFTVAGLPSPAGNLGKKTNVIDASGPVFGSVVVGGGSTVIPVYCDGSDWLVG